MNRLRPLPFPGATVWYSKPCSSSSRHQPSLLTFLAILCITGCNRQPQPIAIPVNQTPSAVEIKPITPLLPHLQTHLGVDSRGNLYWVQESDPPQPGGDLVFLIGPGGVPQTIEDLSVANLIDKLGLTGASGAIRSLAVGPDDNLYLLFIGSRGGEPLYFVARYVPADRHLRIIADTQQLMDASGMGPSLELARGSLLGSSTDLWLWLRHTDGFAILDLHNFTDLEHPIRRLEPKLPDAPRPLRFNDDAEHLSAGPSGILYFIDASNATLWQIAGDGAMSTLFSLEGLPQNLTAPVQVNQRLFIAFSDSRRFATASPAEETDLNHPQIEYPAVLSLLMPDRKPTWFPRSRLFAPENLPLQTLDPRELTVDNANNALILFDVGTGELLRLRFIRQ